MLDSGAIMPCPSFWTFKLCQVSLLSVTFHLYGAPAADLRPGAVQREGHHDSKLVVAKDLLDTMQAKLDARFKTLCMLPGSALEGCQYRHPLHSLGGVLDRTSPVVVGGDYITTESGTGLVHTAPGHGIEDYQVKVQGPSVMLCLEPD